MSDSECKDARSLARDNTHTHTLTPITQLDDLKALQKLYLRDWPTNCLGFYCLDNFIGWLTRSPQINNLHIYTLDNDWRSDGLFLVVDRYQLFLYTLKRSNNSLLLEALSQLNWSNGYKVSSFCERHRDAVLRVVREKQLELEYDSPTYLYYMPKEEVSKLSLNCPTGFYLKTLTDADAELVNQLWPNQHRGSLFFIKRLIAWNENMGVYDINTNELVAWCLRLQAGVLGALQVKDTHKRLGLGSLVTIATAKVLAARGHDVMALVGPNNKPSCGMFEKLGFQIRDTCHWLRTHPTCKGQLWPENDA